MALLTDEVKADCRTIPASIVSKWDFAIETAGSDGKIVFKVHPNEIEFCDGAVVEKDTVAWTFYQNPGNERDKFSNAQ